MKICHLTPHLGGGVGSVIKSFVENSVRLGVTNALWCLDYCHSNFDGLSGVASKKDGVFFHPSTTFGSSERLVHCDVFCVHYWNHPLLVKFFSQNKLPKEKLVIWCHNSGLFEPQVLPKYLLDISSKVVFTSRCSYSAHNLQDLISVSPGKFGVVHSTSDLQKFLSIGENRSYPKRRTNLLYTGTVSASKMHSESAKIFAVLSKQGFSIEVVGGPDHMQLANAVRSHGGEIKVFGEVTDVVPFFQNADLFIYPLRPDHYGTGEQVILEAMAAGLPIIALDNPAERAILEKGGGVLASDVQDFIRNVKNASADHSGHLKEMSLVAINRIRSQFNLERMTTGLVDIMSGVAESARRDVVDHGESFCPQAEIDELVLYALHSFFDGEQMVANARDNLASLEDAVFERIRPSLKTSDSASKWCGLSKSTPFHYQQYFPDNVYVRSICQKINTVCSIASEA